MRPVFEPDDCQSCERAAFWRRVAATRYLALLLALVLASCGDAPVAPTPQPALVPLRPAATTVVAAAAAAPPTVVAAGAELPGRLLFVQGGNLWLWQGASGRQITSSGDAFQPAWSPDGKRIAYIRRVQSYSDLMVMPADGGEPLRLTEDGPDESVYSYERIYASLWAFYPTWSPDGTTIAYVSQAGPPSGSPAGEYNMSLFTIAAGAEAGPRRQIHADDDAHIGRPAFAPDGESIVFARAPRREDRPALFRYDRAADRAAAIPGAPEQSYDPAFSPDGRWLAFAARVPSAGSGETGEGTDVFVMPAAGGLPSRLTNAGTARAPAFAPDGRQLAFLAIAPGGHSFDLWVVDLQAGTGGALQAGQPRQITRDVQIDADSGVAWGR
jgi:TolB protein